MMQDKEKREFWSGVLLFHHCYIVGVLGTVANLLEMSA